MGVVLEPRQQRHEHASVALWRRRSRAASVRHRAMERQRRRRDRRRRDHRALDRVSPRREWSAGRGPRGAPDRTWRVGSRVRPARPLPQAQPSEDRRRPWSRARQRRCPTPSRQRRRRFRPSSKSTRSPARRRGAASCSAPGPTPGGAARRDRRGSRHRTPAMLYGATPHASSAVISTRRSFSTRAASISTRSPTPAVLRASASAHGAFDPSRNACRDDRAARVRLGGPMRRSAGDRRERRPRDQCVFGRSVAAARAQRRAVPGAWRRHRAAARRNARAHPAAGTAADRHAAALFGRAQVRRGGCMSRSTAPRSRRARRTRSAVRQAVAGALSMAADAARRRELERLDRAHHRPVSAHSSAGQGRLERASAATGAASRWRAFSVAISRISRAAGATGDDHLSGDAAASVPAS